MRQSSSLCQYFLKTFCLSSIVLDQHRSQTDSSYVNTNWSRYRHEILARRSQDFPEVRSILQFPLIPSPQVPNFFRPGVWTNYLVTLWAWHFTVCEMVTSIFFAALFASLTAASQGESLIIIIQTSCSISDFYLQDEWPFYRRLTHVKSPTLARLWPWFQLCARFLEMCTKQEDNLFI